jgi:hypothetical protein
VRVLYHRDYWGRVRSICREEIEKEKRKEPVSWHYRKSMAEINKTTGKKWSIDDSLDSHRYSIGYLRNIEKRAVDILKGDIEMSEKKYNLKDEVHLRAVVRRIDTEPYSMPEYYATVGGTEVWLGSCHVITPEPKLSGEEYRELFDEFCKGRTCCDCEIERLEQSTDKTSCAGRIILYRDKVERILESYKAQKEQEKKEAEKRRIKDLYHEIGDIVKCKHTAGSRPFIVTQPNIYKNDYELVCKEKDRMDSRVKQD